MAKTSITKLASRLGTPYFYQAARLFYGTQKQAAKSFGISTRTFQRLAKGEQQASDRTLNHVRGALGRLSRQSGGLFKQLETKAPTLSLFEIQKAERFATRASKHPKRLRKTLREIVKTEDVKTGSAMLARLNQLADEFGFQRVTKSPKKQQKESQPIHRKAELEKELGKLERRLERTKNAAKRAGITQAIGTIEDELSDLEESIANLGLEETEED